MKFINVFNFINVYCNSYSLQYRKPKMWLIVSLLVLTTAFLSRNKIQRCFYIFMKTYKRDLRGCVAFLKLRIVLWWWEKRNYTIPKLFSRLVESDPDKIALYCEDIAWTYQQVNECSNQIANYFKNQGFKKGDCVALLLENRLEYPCIWLGLSKIGVVTALINTNLMNDPLLHSFNVAKSKAVIFGDNHAKVIENVMNKFKLKLYQLHEAGNEKNVLPGCITLTAELNTISKEDPEEVSTSSRHPVVYIYTSGTTGLPKAAIITHIRFIFMTTAFNFMARLTKNDIIYNPLPLYHTAGGMVGIGQMLIHGQASVIRKNFRHQITGAIAKNINAQYVLAAPKKEPFNHCVRAIFGNGLKAQIWNEFVKSFNIKEVYEFYGATEGISNIINIDSTPGCIGFIPRYASFLYPMLLIKCDILTGEPLRDNNGFCIKCGVDEPGLVITKINPNHPFQSFKGYADKKATNAKVLENVFSEGDKYFNSGDILVMDEFGYFYFKDRTGDTFRWKGENVSTSEVEAIISNILNLNDAVVYGVEIPNTDGRAGMAAIVDTNNTLDFDALSKGLRENLPSYAIPVFVRVMKSLPITGTYKLKKVDLQNECYDIEKISDQIYFYDNKSKAYTELTKSLYKEIINGRINV